MTVHDYNQFGGFVWPIPLPAFQEGLLPYYPFDATRTFGIQPYFSAGFVIRKLRWTGVISAAGTGVQLTAALYNGDPTDAGNLIMSATSDATDAATNFAKETTTILTLGKQIFGPTGELFMKVSMPAGDTFTFDGGLAVVYGEFY